MRSRVEHEGSPRVLEKQSYQTTPDHQPCHTSWGLFCVAFFPLSSVSLRLLSLAAVVSRLCFPPLLVRRPVSQSDCLHNHFLHALSLPSPREHHLPALLSPVERYPHPQTAIPSSLLPSRSSPHPNPTQPSPAQPKARAPTRLTSSPRSNQGSHPSCASRQKAYLHVELRSHVCFTVLDARTLDRWLARVWPVGLASGTRTQALPCPPSPVGSVPLPWGSCVVCVSGQGGE